MTDSDVLARAAKALREAHTGEREGSGFTRARIMNTLHRERRRRTLRWAILSPLASVLLVGSAWAQSSGKWPVIWNAVASVFVAAPAGDSVPARSPQAPPPRPQPGARRDVVAPSSSVLVGDAGAEPALSAPPVIQGTPASGGAAGAAAAKVEARAPGSRRPPRLRRAPSADPSGFEPEPAPSAREAHDPREPQPERELGRFRRAHDLHFAGRARDAIDAYAEYLREYPKGRFMPEARYAIALDQIKLGNDAAAREALTPFAAGHYAGYRQAEARKLLEALSKKEDGAR